MNVSPQCIYSAHRRIILNWTLWPLFPLHLSAASMWYRGVGGACRYYGFVVCRREWRYFRLTKDRTDVHTINGYYKFLATSGTMIVVHDAKVVASAEFKHTWGFERVKCVFRVAGLACPIVVTHWPLNSFTGHQTLSIGLGSSGSELRCIAAGRVQPQRLAVKHRFVLRVCWTAADQHLFAIVSTD